MDHRVYSWMNTGADLMKFLLMKMFEMMKQQVLMVWMISTNPVFVDLCWTTFDEGFSERKKKEKLFRDNLSLVPKMVARNLFFCSL
jgi:hypothetical protein